jgi:hypothetical protein
VRVGCLVIGMAGLACQPGVLLPPPDVPEVHLTFQCPAETFHDARGPTVRTVVEQPKQPVVEPLILRTVWVPESQPYALSCGFAEGDADPVIHGCLWVPESRS